MKNTFIVLTSIFSLIFVVSLNASADAVLASQDAQAVVESLQCPQNLSAEMLKAAVDSAKVAGLSLEVTSINQLDKDRYQLTFRLDSKESNELAEVNVSEVLIRDGKAYVFGFNVERIVKLKKYPGVSLGNN